MESFFPANDLVAAGALDRPEDGGLRIPDDISLVGYRNASSRRCTTSAWTVNQPRADVTHRLALELVMWAATVPPHAA